MSNRKIVCTNWPGFFGLNYVAVAATSALLDLLAPLDLPQLSSQVLRRAGQDEVRDAVGLAVDVFLIFKRLHPSGVVSGVSHWADP